MQRIEKRTLVFLLVAPVALLVAFFLFKRQEPVTAHHKRELELAKKWRELAYEEIWEGPEFLQKVKEIKALTNCPVSQVQLSGLYESIYNLLIAFKTGSYEDYRKFRTPVAARLNLDLLEGERESLSKKLTPGKRLPKDPEKFFKFYVSRLNEGKGFTNYWLGVALVDASVVFEESRSHATNGLWAFADHHEKLGLWRPNPHFLFDITPENVLERNGNLLFATVSMVIKHASPDPPYLMHIRYFWEDREQKWIPWEYVSAYSRPHNWRLIW
jgi:hypothetical protein